MEMEKINECAGEKLNLKVIGAGLPRTGTSSLRDALNILGFPCYHFSELRKNNQADLWLDILSGKSEDWKSVFSGYVATVDFPSVTVYRKLMEVCPDAKIILTVRDKETWYDSVKNTVYHANKERSVMNPVLELARLTWYGLFHGRFNQDREYTMSVHESHVEAVKNYVPVSLAWEGLSHGRFEDRDYVMSVYEEHVEAVKNYVPAHKLLVFNVKEGWAPLCNFLGVPLPPADTPFPHSNDTAQFLKRRLKNL